MRLIDADEYRKCLIDHMTVPWERAKYDISDDYNKGLYDAARLLNIEPTITPEPHWIPVTERLPETDDEVLTTYIVNGNREKRYVETSCYYDSFDGRWSSPWDEYRIVGTRIEVIAWMPLPEAFKGVTE